MKQGPDKQEQRSSQVANEPPSCPPKRPASVLLIGAGSMFTAMILVGFLLGFALDRWLGTEPWLMMVLGAMGLVGGILRMLRLLT